MSNSNNPYSTEENDRNENNDQSNSRAINDDSSKFLEEAPPNIAPPPAYEDVVKPQPILPSYDYHNNYPQNNQSNQSYHPPAIPPPAGNYNQTSTRPANSNKNRGPPRCCCCCVPSRSRNKSCGCGWIIVFFAFIILTTISVANNNACNKIPIEENPHQFSFDSSKTLYINVDNARLKRGEVRIFQGQQTQDFINVDVYTGSKGTTPQFGTSNRNGNNELIISQTSGFSIFNVPPRCMKARIDVYLPDTLISNTIKVRDLNVLVSNTQKFLKNINLITEDGSMLLNYTNAQNISLLTRDGTILLNNAVVDRISINTEDGDVGGSLTLNNELSISTLDGDVDLFAKIAQNANNANIKVNTNDGDVGLSFGNSFSGIYDILSRDGRIRTNADNNRGNHVVGNFNNGGNVGNVGNSGLNITTDDGNVLVLF